MSYNPNFSKVLYVVPTVNAEGDTDNSAAVSDAILAGGSIFSSGTTLQTMQVVCLLPSELSFL